MFMKFGIGIFPSKKIQDLANSYRKRYDPHYALIPPHLTLKDAFEESEEKISDITNTLQKIATETNPFQLKINKFSSFQPVNNVIYLKVEPSNELSLLHQLVNEKMGGHQSEYSFVPHITIGQKLSNDEHSDVLGTLRMMQINHEQTVDRFHLLYQLENGSWTVYETFRLGKE